jgi:Der1-like family
MSALTVFIDESRFAACGIAVCWRNRRLQIARQTTFGCYCFPLLCFSCVFLSSTFCPPALLTTIPQAISPLVNLPFLSSPLAFVPIYLWSRRHPSTPISLFGLFTISAPYLPVALVAFSWVLNGTWKAAAGDLLGCAVGHVSWFLRDVWSREMIGGTSFLTEAPPRLCVLI